MLSCLCCFPTPSTPIGSDNRAYLQRAAESEYLEECLHWICSLYHLWAIAFGKQWNSRGNCKSIPWLGLGALAWLLKCLEEIVAPAPLWSGEKRRAPPCHFPLRWMVLIPTREKSGSLAFVFPGFLLFSKINFFTQGRFCASHLGSLIMGCCNLS